MKTTIGLSNGVTTTLDPEDIPRFYGRWTWTAARNGGIWYVVRVEDRHTIKLHRAILNAPDGIVVHHINGDGLDNRKDNLLLCTVNEHRKLFALERAILEPHSRALFPRYKLNRGEVSDN